MTPEHSLLTHSIVTVAMVVCFLSLPGCCKPEQNRPNRIVGFSVSYDLAPSNIDKLVARKLTLMDQLANAKDARKKEIEDRLEAIEEQLARARAQESQDVEEMIRILQERTGGIREHEFVEVKLEGKLGEEIREEIRKDSEAREYVFHGTIHYAEGRYHKAIVAYKKAIALNPDGDFAYYQLGDAYKSLGQYADAIDVYKKGISISLTTDSAFGYVGMGDVYYKLGQYKDAVAAYKKGISLKPDYSVGYVGMGDVYYKLGQSQDAIAAYEKGISIDPTGDWVAEAGKKISKLSTTQPADN